MGTNYKSNGTISIKHLLKMKDEVNEKSLKETQSVADKYKNEFGTEYEVCCHNHATNYKT